MTRRYDEPITVSLCPGPVGQDPQGFTWRGHDYTVCAIHERWTQRRSWWRDSELDPAQVALERRVWRVEACRVRGRVQGVAIGVFELGLDAVMPDNALPDNAMRNGAAPVGGAPGRVMRDRALSGATFQATSNRSGSDVTMSDSRWLLLRAED